MGRQLRRRHQQHQRHGHLQRRLYSAGDTTCATALETVTAAVNGDGSYESPPVTPANAGTYQWVATYGGDASHAVATNACNDTAEQVVVSAPKSGVEAACVASKPLMSGVVRRVRNRLTASVRAPGAKSVTFYLDGRKLKTVTRAKNNRFSLTITARRLSYGAHKVRAKVTMNDSNCANGALAGRFIHVKTAVVHPKFAG